MTQAITPFIRRMLLADALASGATAILLLAGAGPLAPLLAISAGFMFRAGLVLAVFVAFLVVLSCRTTAPRLVLLDVVLVNLLWVVASIAVLAAGIVAPNTLGTLFILAQALAVAVLAALQWMALRRPAPVAA